jgi:hypothetical protein
MTMAEIENTLADLIRFSSEQKPIEFGAAFNSLIANRIEAAIDTKKIEVAQAMFNPSLDADDEDIEQESEEE